MDNQDKVSGLVSSSSHIVSGGISSAWNLLKKGGSRAKQHMEFMHATFSAQDLTASGEYTDFLQSFNNARECHRGANRPSGLTAASTTILEVPNYDDLASDDEGIESNYKSNGNSASVGLQQHDDDGVMIIFSDTDGEEIYTRFPEKTDDHESGTASDTDHNQNNFDQPNMEFCEHPGLGNPQTFSQSEDGSIDDCSEEVRNIVPVQTFLSGVPPLEIEADNKYCSSSEDEGPDVTELSDGKIHPSSPFMQSVTNICNTFWRPNLTFSTYKHGDFAMTFMELWPAISQIRTLLPEVIGPGSIQTSLPELIKIVLRCGPVIVLRILLDDRVINVNQRFKEDGSTLLHMAVIAQNFDAVLLLCAKGASSAYMDNQGRTVFHVCYNKQIRRLLPPHFSTPPVADKSPSKVTAQGAWMIFQLAKHPKHFNELQIKLQASDFNVNRETNSDGDYLVHVVVRQGICQLPLLHALATIQEADVNVINKEGCSALMLAVQDGDLVLVDLLLCVFGADINLVNSVTGWTALHYAAKANNVEMVSCLIKRGADVNMEASDGSRADDIAANNAADDTKLMIENERLRRMKHLWTSIKEEEIDILDVNNSDLFLVDDDGDTLIMCAARFNRHDNLIILLQKDDTAINAQNHKTGQTALCIAAQEGHAKVVHILLSCGANPTIKDLEGFMPIHQAVRMQNLQALDALLEFPAALTGLSLAVSQVRGKMMEKSIIMAVKRRQKEVVNPALFMSAVNGNADQLFSILEGGDTVNTRIGVGDWPMYLAVSNGHYEVVRLLYEWGGDINHIHENTGNSVLHAACSNGHEDIIKFLLKHYRWDAQMKGTRINIVNVINKQQVSPLQIAASKGYRNIVQMLIDHGATTAIIDSQGQLFQCPNFEGIQILLETTRKRHTASIMSAIRKRWTTTALQNIWESRFDHNLRDSDGDTPLMVACHLGRYNATQFLLKSAVYLVNSQLQDMPLPPEKAPSDLSAIFEASVSTLSRYMPKSKKYLSSFIHRQNENTNTQESQTNGSSYYRTSDVLNMSNNNLYDEKSDYLDDTPSQYQTTRNVLEESYSQFTYGIDSPVIRLPEQEAGGQVDRYTTFLDSITQPKQPSIFISGNKISHICAVNPRDGSTALHRVVQGGDNVSILMMLLSTDQSVANIQDKEGLTALHWACKLKRRRIVEKLVGLYYVDLNLRTLDGCLPEELTRDSRLHFLIQRMRTQMAPGSSGTSNLHRKQQQRLHDEINYGDSASAFSADVDVVNYEQAGFRRQPSYSPSSVDFDALNDRFQDLKTQFIDPVTAAHMY